MIFKSIDSLVDRVAMDMRAVERLIDHLNDDGYVVNFILKDGRLKCLQTDAVYFLTEVKVEKVFQVDDPLIGWSGYYIYAIREPISNTRGVFITELIKSSRSSEGQGLY